MISKTILLFVSALFLTSCSTFKNKNAGGQNGEAATPNILGLWRSPSPEPAGNGQHFTKEYNISMGRWEMIHTHAADKEMKKILYVYRAEGSYSLAKPSQKAVGAFDLDFKMDRKFLNLRSKDKALAKELGVGNCKLTIGKEKDVSDEGCGFLKSIKECPQEYDLAKVEETGLRLGDRPTDGEVCTPDTRPEMLGGALKKLN